MPSPRAPSGHARLPKPVQRRSSRQEQTASDFYCTPCIKHAGISEFFSYAQYLYAGLLEGAIDVVAFVPQPFELAGLCVPQFYVLHRSEQETVVILRASPHKSDALLSKTVKSAGASLEIVDPTQVLKREVEARNWHQIIKYMISAADQTNLQELSDKILSFLADAGELDLNSVIRHYQALPQEWTLAATFHLRHIGRIGLELDCPVSLRSAVWLA